MRRQLKLYLFALSLVLGVNLKAPAQESDTAPLVQHIIPPQATDPEIDTRLDPHYVWLDPTQQPDDPMLWVFLPGASGKPQQHQLVAKEAARLGYHVIVLMYANGDAVGAICNPLPAQQRESCYENIRLQTLDGIVRSNFTQVNPPNSTFNRLTKLLQYLAANFPEEGWKQFLKDGSPRWSRIAIAGFSRGGGDAALIGKLHRVARVVMFSSPTDGLLNADQPARWVSIGATPANRYFGLGHQREFPIRPIRANWNALGLGVFGPPVVPEASAPPYGGTHMLLTDLLPATGSYNQAHGTVALDDFTPLAADGTPVLRDAWRYISGQPGHERDENEDEDENIE